VQGETAVPTYEELQLIHDVLDPDEIFIPKAAK
jgi:glutaconate CoA-transferase subunit B